MIGITTIKSLNSVYLSLIFLDDHISKSYYIETTIITSREQSYYIYY